MQTRTCKGSDCGNQFDVYPSSERTWCSVVCKAAHRKVRSDKGSRKVEWVPAECPCGMVFEVPPWQTAQNVYCSTACVRKYARGADRGGGRKPLPDLKSYTREGYLTVYIPPEDRPAGMRGSRYAEHRWVMMQRLGRDLLPGENVHHINGVRTDNRPENLELWITSQPKGQRVSDALAWAHEIINRYQPEGATMPTHYVEDYEEVTGQKPEDVIEDTPSEVETKVVTAPVKAEPKKTVAQTKAPKAK